MTNANLTKEEILNIMNMSEETLKLIIEINEGNAIKVLTDLEKIAKKRLAKQAQANK